MLTKHRLLILSLAILSVGLFKIHGVGSSESQASRYQANSDNTPGTQSVKTEGQKNEPSKNLIAEVSAQYAQHTYQESKMSIAGPMAGVSGSLLTNVGDNIYLGGRGEYMAGEPTYTGEYIDINNTGVRRPVSAKSKDQFLDVAGLGELEIYHQNRNSAFLFSGLAYRFHNNRVENAGGYTREISHAYLPLGANGSMSLSNNWKLRSEGEIDVMVSGQTKSYLSEVSSGDTDVTHTQSRGFGFKINLRAECQFSNMSLQFGPYYTYWKVDDSDVVPATLDGKSVYVIEPENTTTRLGVSLGLLF